MAFISLSLLGLKRFPKLLYVGHQILPNYPKWKSLTCLKSVWLQNINVYVLKSLTTLLYLECEVVVLYVNVTRYFLILSSSVKFTLSNAELQFRIYKKGTAVEYSTVELHFLFLEL